MRAWTQLLTATVVALSFLSGAAFAADPGSRSWINKRVNFWEHVCLRPVLSGKSFETASRKAGFSRNPDGTFSYKKTEIVASMRGSGAKCECRFTFGSTKPNKAATSLIQRTVRVAGGKFTPDESPQSVGSIRIGKTRADVRVFKFRNFDADWVGATITGTAACAAKI